jgi:putative ABC transport system permease protein
LLAVIIRNHRAHPFRLALLCLAIGLGVAFLAATLVLSDSEHTGLDVASSQAFGSVALDVQGTGFPNPVPLPAALLGRISSLPGVARVEGAVGGSAQLLDHNKVLFASSDATTIGLSIGPIHALDPVHLVTGHLPAAADEVVVDLQTFRNEHWSLGQRVAVASLAPVQMFRVVGTVAIGNTGQILGSSVVGFTPTEAQHEFNLVGEYSNVLVQARAGIDEPALAREVARAIGPRFEVLTGPQYVTEQETGFGRLLPNIAPIIGVLIGVVLFAGALVIFNALSMMMASRRRELALLRCLGASRAQVFTSVVCEAGVLGLFSSAVGLALGVSAGALVQEALAGTSQTLAVVGPVVTIWTVLACLGLGVCVSVTAAIIPARQAAGAAPLEAFRLDATEEVTRGAARAIVIGATLGALGTVLMAIGLFAAIGGKAVFFGAGIALALLAAGLVGPLVVPPLVTFAGWPLVRLGGVATALGRGNAARNPRRTARTTWALVIGVALVSFLGIISTSARASTDQQLDQSLSADFVLQHAGDAPLSTGPQGSIPISRTLLGRLVAKKNLYVSPFEFVVFGADGHFGYGAAVDEQTISHLIDFHHVDGSITSLSNGGLAASGPQALKRHLRVGEVLHLVFGPRVNSQPVAIPLDAIYAQGDHESGYLFSVKAIARSDPGLALNAILVSAKPGVSVQQARGEVETVLTGFPSVTLQDQELVQAGENQDINQQINIVTGILILAVFIGILGLANTLALAIFERRRELATLHAIGMTQRQIRSMVRTESALIGLIGAIAGVCLGIFLGWAFQRALASQGLDELVIPWGLLALYALGGATVGVLAGAFPARQAARQDSATLINALTSD